jgi:tetratricopeptide (TPR) repeat protein
VLTCTTTLLAALGLLAVGGVALAHGPIHDKIAFATQRISVGIDPAAELLMRGEFHRLAGDWKAAQADFDAAAALEPQQPGLELCRAALMMDRGQLEGAHAAVTDLLAREPHNERAWKLRSQISEKRQRPDAAAADLERALDVSPRPSPDLYVERARLLQAAGLDARALQCLDEGIARLGSIVSLELAAAEIELDRGNRSGALARLDRVAPQMERPEILAPRRAAIFAQPQGEGAKPEPSSAPFVIEVGRPVVESPMAMVAAAADVLGSNAPAPSLTDENTPLVPEPPAPRSARPVTPARMLADPVVTRGPYLQIGTPTGVTIRWRTDVASTSRVLYGTNLGNLDGSVQSGTLTTEHEVVLTGLTSNQRYYYSIGTTSLALEGNDAAHSFVTAPAPGTTRPTRIWIIGDAGTATNSQAEVRDAFVDYTGTRGADVWLMLGDNAYDSGQDEEYQAGVFDMYEEQLKNTILWPTRGNHDQIHSGPGNDYYDIFSLPTAGQAGGLASGTEAY